MIYVYITFFSISTRKLILFNYLQLKLYNTVIEDVIAGVRESFIDEGVDEQVLQELKQIWETKLLSCKAVEMNPDPPESQVSQLNPLKAISINKGKYTNKNQTLDFHYNRI